MYACMCVFILFAYKTETLGNGNNVLSGMVVVCVSGLCMAVKEHRTCV